MNYLNVGSLKIGAQLLKASSCSNQVLHPASNILDENKQTIWLSGDGLPQSLIISLEGVTDNYKNICTIGICCQHDYETNPKTIEMWVCSSIEAMEQDEFICWEDLKLQKKSGTQLFSIESLPESYRIIKIIITETFGEYETYLNEVLLLAEIEEQSSQSLLFQEDWQELKRGRSKPRSNPHFKDRQAESGILGLPGPSPIKNIQEVFNRPNYTRSSQSRLRESELNGLDHEADTNSEQQNAAMLAISNNIVIMEQNMEELNRKMEVLEIKVDTAYQSLERKLILKFNDIIDSKISRKIIERDSFQRKHSENRLKFTRQIATSRETKPMRSQGKSEKHLYRRYHRAQVADNNKDERVKVLMCELQKKLRQRQKKMRRLQARTRSAVDQYYG